MPCGPTPVAFLGRRISTSESGIWVKRRNIGASVITYTHLGGGGVPYNGPQNPILIIKAPIIGLWAQGSLGSRALRLRLAGFIVGRMA